MKDHIYFTVALGFTALKLVNSWPTSADNTLFRRQNVTSQNVSLTIQDCQSPDMNPQPECWTILGIDAYLQVWWANNSQSCSSGDFAGDGFASCYQQKVGKGALLNDDCDKIGVSDCRPPPNFSSYDPKEFYVLTSIFGIWQWFNSIYYATDFANGVASEKIGDIVTTINPIQSNGALGIILSVLTGGLAFLDVPAKAIETAIAASVSLEAKIGTFSTILQQAPGLARALMAPATLAGQFNEKNQIEASLATIVTAFQTNVANGLAAGQRNFSNFMPLAANGSFIARHASLNASTSILTQVLTTYITSQALGAKGYNVRYANVRGTYLSPGYGLSPISNIDCGIKFTSVDQDSHAAQCGEKMLNTITGKGWATADDLFNGTVACNVATVAKNGDPKPSPYMDPVTLTPLCIANLALYIDEGVQCPPRAKCGQAFQVVLTQRQQLNGQTQRDFDKKFPAVDKYLAVHGV